MAHDPLDDRGFLDNRQETHLTTTVWADERGNFIDFIDQPCPGTTGRRDVFRIWIVWVRVKPSGCISLAIVTHQKFSPIRYVLQKKRQPGGSWHGDGGERYATKAKSSTKNRKVCQQRL